jgi:hypothetical protein
MGQNAGATADPQGYSGRRRRPAGREHRGRRDHRVNQVVASSTVRPDASTPCHASRGRGGQPDRSARTVASAAARSYSKQWRWAPRTTIGRSPCSTRWAMGRRDQGAWSSTRTGPDNGVCAAPTSGGGACSRGLTRSETACCLRRADGGLVPLQPAWSAVRSARVAWLPAPLLLFARGVDLLVQRQVSSSAFRLTS